MRIGGRRMAGWLTGRLNDRLVCIFNRNCVCLDEQRVRVLCVFCLDATECDATICHSETHTHTHTNDLFGSVILLCNIVALCVYYVIPGAAEPTLRG